MRPLAAATAHLALAVALSTWKDAGLGLGAGLQRGGSPLLGLADALPALGSALESGSTAASSRLPCLACVKIAMASPATAFLSVTTAVIRLTIAVPSLMTALARTRNGLVALRDPEIEGATPRCDHSGDASRTFTASSRHCRLTDAPDGGVLFVKRIACVHPPAAAPVT